MKAWACCVFHTAPPVFIPPPTHTHTVIIPAQKYFTMFIVGLVFRSAMSVFSHPRCKSVFLHSVFNLIPFPALLDFARSSLGTRLDLFPRCLKPWFYFVGNKCVAQWACHACCVSNRVHNPFPSVSLRRCALTAVTLPRSHEPQPCKAGDQSPIVRFQEVTWKIKRCRRWKDNAA